MLSKYRPTRRLHRGLVWSALHYHGIKIQWVKIITPITNEVYNSFQPVCVLWAVQSSSSLSILSHIRNLLTKKRETRLGSRLVNDEAVWLIQFSHKFIFLVCHYCGDCCWCGCFCCCCSLCISELFISYAQRTREMLWTQSFRTALRCGNRWAAVDDSDLRSKTLITHSGWPIVCIATCIVWALRRPWNARTT